MREGRILAWAAVVSTGVLLVREPVMAGDAPDSSSNTAALTSSTSQDPKLEDLERRLDQQQKEIDELRKEKEAAELRGKPAPPIDERSGIQAAVAQAPQDALFDWGYDGGFYVRGTLNDASYELRPRMRLQLDYRAYPHASSNDEFPHPVPDDQFLVRRFRIGFGGHFGPFNFTLDVDPSRSGLPLGDFWFEAEHKDGTPSFLTGLFGEDFDPIDALGGIKIRIGHFKAPFECEDGLTDDRYLDMVERPMVVNSGPDLAPDFRPGAEVVGNVGGGLFQYWICAQNQADSNTVASGDPLETARIESDIGGLAIGVGGCWERLSGVQTSFPGLTPGQFQFFAPVDVRGWTQRYVADITYYQGPFSARGEFLYAVQQRWHVLADHTSGTGLDIQGAALTAAWLFWGPPDDVSHPLSVPFANWKLFSMDTTRHKNDRNVGMEFLVRLDWADFDEARGGRQGQNGVPALPSTAANADRVKGNEAKAVWAGVNLDVMENVRFMFDYVAIDIGDMSRAEHAHSRLSNELLFRAQMEF